MAQLRSLRDGMRTRRTDSATFARIAPGAPFLSQLIAANARPAPRRPGPDAAAGGAARTYAAGATIAVRRLPPGSHTSREA